MQEVTEEEAVLIESLQDEAANTKIKLTMLVKLTNSVLGMASMVQSVEVGNESVYKIIKIPQG